MSYSLPTISGEKMGVCCARRDDCTTEYRNLYEIPATDIDGHTVSMESYRGKVLLIVNVASR